jgi:alpha-D-xyloside xylohydrolase
MTKPYRELEPKNMLIDIETWPQSGLTDWPPRRDYPSGVRPYDPYSKEARDIYWNHLTRLYDLNIDGWWMDSTEPDHMDFKETDLDLPTAMGPWRRVRNAFPLMAVGGVYDNQRAMPNGNDKRVLILTRSVFAGQQRYGSNTWSGDVQSNWNSLRNQVPAGLNFALTGNPNFNSDLGGFFANSYNERSQDGSATKNPLYQELYVRWMQYGVFCPMMRSHGTEVPRELYYYGQAGEPVYDALLGAVKMRYSLLPYIYSLAHDVNANNGTYQRALMMDFKNDRNVWNIGNEFMFGRSLLVAPVLEAKYTPERAQSKSRAGIGNVDFMEAKSTRLYLPAGTSWYDFETMQKYDGGQEIERTVNIKSIPLYVKAGSILPIGPDVQYSTEKPWDDLEIRVYAGANGTFCLYEDEFDNYNYEKGAFSTIDFSWNDKSRSLTIGARKGTYDGMIKNRKFRVILIKDGKRSEAKTITYTGKKVTVKL